MQCSVEALGDTRTGKDRRHSLTGQVRQSVFGSVARYEDVNDAGRAVTKEALATSQMGRFETKV
jgi:hypothetical protein